MKKLALTAWERRMKKEKSIEENIITHSKSYHEHNIPSNIVITCGDDSINKKFS